MLSRSRRLQSSFFRSPRYATINVNSPGSTNVITPPHMHISVEVLSSVGMSANITVGAHWPCIFLQCRVLTTKVLIH